MHTVDENKILETIYDKFINLSFANHLRTTECIKANLKQAIENLQWNGSNNHSKNIKELEQIKCSIWNLYCEMYMYNTCQNTRETKYCYDLLCIVIDKLHQKDMFEDEFIS